MACEERSLLPIFCSTTAGRWTPSTAPCYFLALPPELRLRIYEYVYTDDWNNDGFELRISTAGNVYAHINDFGDDEDETKHLRQGAQVASLIRTCQTILEEARPVMWASYDVHIDMFLMMENDTEEEMEGLWCLGAVRECMWLKHVRSVAEFGIDMPSHEWARAARAVGELVALLGCATEGKLALMELSLSVQNRESGLAALEALVALRSESAVKVAVGYGFLVPAAGPVRLDGPVLPTFSAAGMMRELCKDVAINQLLRQLKGKLIPSILGYLGRPVTGEGEGDTDTTNNENESPRIS